LPACPTYLALEDENDSPRGRIVLMDGVLDGRIPADDATVTAHLDRCLGCRGCESACPSGVPYGALLEATRETMQAERPLPLVARAVLAVFAHELLLRPALLLARVFRALGIARFASRVLPVGLAMPFAMLEATARPRAVRWEASGDGSRGRVALLTGCVMEGLLTPVNRATERVLVRNGHTLCSAPGQVCCGALHAHAGDTATARTLAKANIAAFEESGAVFVTTNSAGCGAMCKDYGHLLHDDPEWRSRAAAFSSRLRDVHELLAAAGPAPADHRDPSSDDATRLAVAWDAPCHLEHAQRVTAPPLAVLRAIGSLDLRPLAASDQCCGSAGIFNLTQPEVAARVVAPKLVQIASTRAAVVATAPPGCLMQIGGALQLAGSAVVTRHPVELLDAAYAQEVVRG
jgi:glycolate oxidase iron-sulfur subunit